MHIAYELIELAEARTERYRVKQAIQRRKKQHRQMLMHPDRFPFMIFATVPEFISAVTGYPEESVYKMSSRKAIHERKLITELTPKERDEINRMIERIVHD